MLLIEFDASKNYIFSRSDPVIYITTDDSPIETT